jgi:hypothetical protein
MGKTIDSPFPSSFEPWRPNVDEVRKVRPEMAVKSEALLTGSVSQEDMCPHISSMSPAHGDTNGPSSHSLLESMVHEWTLKWSTRGDREKWTFVKQVLMVHAHGPRRRPRVDIANVHAQTTHKVGTWSARGPHVKTLKFQQQQKIKYFSIMYVYVLFY